MYISDKCMFSTNICSILRLITYYCVFFSLSFPIVETDQYLWIWPIQYICIYIYYFTWPNDLLIICLLYMIFHLWMKIRTFFPIGVAYCCSYRVRCAYVKQHSIATSCMSYYYYVFNLYLLFQWAVCTARANRSRWNWSWISIPGFILWIWVSVYIMILFWHKLKKIMIVVDESYRLLL